MGGRGVGVRHRRPSVTRTVGELKSGDSPPRRCADNAAKKLQKSYLLRRMPLLPQDNRPVRPLLDTHAKGLLHQAREALRIVGPENPGQPQLGQRPVAQH